MGQKLRVRFPKPPDESKPYIGEVPNAHRAEPVQKVPINQEIVDQVRNTKKVLPKQIKPNIEDVRAFFLTEIAPLILGVTNGLQDAKEILERTFEEPVDTQAIFHVVEDSMNRAMLVKIISFIQNYTNLDEQERKVHSTLHLLKENPNHANIETLLLEMLKVSNVPRSKKGG